jgi:hypothetical protein
MAHMRLPTGGGGLVPGGGTGWNFADAVVVSTENILT